MQFSAQQSEAIEKASIWHNRCNRCCVNPLHLEMVTHRENQKRRDQAK